MVNRNVLRRGAYIAATAEELSSAHIGKKLAAVINQRVFFRHRGKAELSQEELRLSSWVGNDDLVIAVDEVVDLQRRFTKLYGRFLGGGSAEWGAPVIISRSSGSEIYLLFDHRAFLEKSTNVEWHLELLDWMRRG